MQRFSERLLADLRRIRRGLITAALTAFLVTAASTLAFTSGVRTLVDGIEPLTAPTKPLAYLQVIDPYSSLDSAGYGGAFAGDTPGLRHLDEARATHPGVYTVLRLGELVGNASGSQADTIVIIGARPPGIPQPENADAPGDPSAQEPAGSRAEGTGELWLWGDLTGADPEVTNARLGGAPVHQVSPHRLDSRVLLGRDWQRLADVNVLYAERFASIPNSLRANLTVTTSVVNATLCFCEPTELNALADEMNAAERASRAERTYFAASYESLRGPIGASASASSALTGACALGVIGVLVTFMLALITSLWRRRAHAYSVEATCGAAPLGQLMRQQVWVLAAFTLPAALGFLAADTVFVHGIATIVPPWPPAGGWVALAIFATAHAIVSVPTIVRIARIHTVTSRGGPDV